MSWEDRQSNYDRYPKIKIKEIDKLSSKAYEGYADIVIDAPTFHIFIAAFLSLSWLVLHFVQIHSRTAKFLVSGFFVPQTWQICELG